MGEILLDYNELNMKASSVNKLKSEIENIQNEIKAAVNQFDGDQAGNFVKDITDRMYEVHKSGQALSASMMEVASILNEAVKVFSQVDQSVGKNMDAIYADPSKAKAIKKKLRTSIKKEIKSDFVTIDKKASNIKSQSFERQKNYGVVGDIRNCIKAVYKNKAFQDTCGIIGAIAVIASGGFAGWVVGGAMLITSISDAYGDATGKGSPAKKVVEHFMGKKAGDNVYDGVEITGAVFSMFYNPSAAASKINMLSKMNRVTEEASKVNKISGLVSKTRSVLDESGDLKYISHPLRDTVDFYKSVKSSVINVGSYARDNAAAVHQAYDNTIIGKNQFVQFPDSERFLSCAKSVKNTISKLPNALPANPLAADGINVHDNVKEILSSN